MWIVPKLLILSFGIFRRHEILEDRQGSAWLGNNLELSIKGDLEFGLNLLRSTPEVILSLRSDNFDKTGHLDSFRSQAIEIILGNNMSDFLQSLTRVVQNTQFNSHVYILLWPEICATEVEASQRFHKFVVPYLRNLTLRSDLYIMFPTGTGKSNDSLTAVIWEGYTVANTFITKKLEMESKNSLNWFYLFNKITRRKNAGQATLRAISVNDSSWENETKYVLRKDNNTEIMFESGYAVQMLWVIRDLYNFSLKAMEGNWTGFTDGENDTSYLSGNGQTVADGDADISISQHSLNLEYFYHNLFLLHPTNSVGLRLYFIQPDMSQYRDIFLTPFSGDLWITVIGMLIILMVTVKSFGYILLHITDDDEEDELVESVMVWGVAIVAQQGYHVEPSSLSIRIVFLFGYITGLLCFIAYSAQIVSTLSIKTVPIHKAEDILDGPFHLYANPNNTPKAVISHILKEHSRSTDSVFMEEDDAIRRILKSPGVMQAIVAEPDSFFAEAEAANCTDKEICETFSSLRLHRVPIKGGMFSSRDSPFIEWFDYAIILMFERGLNHRFVTNYIRKTWVICLDEKNAFVRPVKVSDILSAFKILGAGFVSSLVALLVEIIIMQGTRRRLGNRGIFQFLI